MTEKPGDYGREVRDSVVKSGLTGVAATVLAVTIFSPAGFGGLVGTSLASGFGLDPNAAAANDPYANLPPYPTPLTVEELSEIHNTLARTNASLEITRAATAAKIERIRSIALSPGAVTFTAAVPQAAQAPPGLRLTTSEPAATAETDLAIATTPVSYGGGGAPYRDPHLELADLLLAHETF
jgi:hypothetical protein